MLVVHGIDDGAVTAPQGSQGSQGSQGIRPDAGNHAIGLGMGDHPGEQLGRLELPGGACQGGKIFAADAAESRGGQVAQTLPLRQGLPAGGGNGRKGGVVQRLDDRNAKIGPTGFLLGKPRLQLLGGQLAHRLVHQAVHGIDAEPGHHRRIKITKAVSAVGGHIRPIRRSEVRQDGGFDPRQAGIGHNLVYGLAA